MKILSIILATLTFGVCSTLIGCGETSGTGGTKYDSGNHLETPPPESSKIYIYNGGLQTGNLNGRTGADAICDQTRPTDLAGFEVHAFISVDATDEIRDMPTQYGVPTDLKIVSFSSDESLGNTWSDLLDGTLAHSLEDAGVLNAGETFWSGSDVHGVIAGVSCNSWQSNLGTVFGAAGSGTSPTTWAYTISADCSAVRNILCIAYQN
jgi:hypothetical protein